MIRLALFGLIYGAALSELTAEGRILWMGSFFLSRCLSGYTVVAFPKAKKTGLAERNRIPRLEELRASFCCKEGFASPG